MMPDNCTIKCYNNYHKRKLPFCQRWQFDKLNSINKQARFTMYGTETLYKTYKTMRL